MGHAAQDVNLPKRQRNLRSRLRRHRVLVRGPCRPHGEKRGGTIAFGPSHDCVARVQLAKDAATDRRNYSDVIVMTIAVAKQDDQSFSADTGMAETLVVCRQSMKASSDAACSFHLIDGPEARWKRWKWPERSQESLAMPNSGCWKMDLSAATPITIGGEKLAESIDAPFNAELPWSAGGSIRLFGSADRSPDIARTIFGCLKWPTNHRFLCRSVDRRLPTSALHDNDIVGNGPDSAHA